MSLPEPLCRSLRAVATAMAGAQDRWWIIASAAVALHGARPTDVGDVDVLLSVRDARRVLPRLGLVARAGDPDARFRSAVFASWTAPPLAVEFMAGFEHHDGTGWQRVVPATRRPVDVAGMRVFVPEVAELRAMLVRFGRAKDLVRAGLLDALR